MLRIWLANKIRLAVIWPLKMRPPTATAKSRKRWIPMMERLEAGSGGLLRTQRRNRLSTPGVIDV